MVRDMATGMLRNVDRLIDQRINRFSSLRQRPLLWHEGALSEI
jgi:hypothetical protein